VIFVLADEVDENGRQGERGWGGLRNFVIIKT